MRQLIGMSHMVNGLHVFLINGHREKGNLLTFVYTYIDHPEFKKLEGNLVTSKFMDGEISMKVLYTSKFLMGHRTAIDIGWVSVDELKKVLSKKNPITIEYVDSSEILCWIKNIIKSIIYFTVTDPVATTVL